MIRLTYSPNKDIQGFGKEKSENELISFSKKGKWGWKPLALLRKQRRNVKTNLKSSCMQEFGKEG